MMTGKLTNLHRSMRILIVSPDKQLRANQAKLLALSGAGQAYKIFEAASEAEALVLFGKEHPDLLLVSPGCVDDLRLSGQRLCAAVRAQEKDRHTGIIFVAPRQVDMTEGGSSLEIGLEGPLASPTELSVECLEMGADDFLRPECTPEELAARVRAVLRLKAMTDQLRSANHKLRILSMTDDLTGLANMRSFNQRFSEIRRRCRQGKTALGVIMLDLDHFKTVNDTTNHLIGSFVLSEIGRILKDGVLFEGSDVVARYGGDEFIAVVAAKDVKTLAKRAEQIRERISRHAFAAEGCTIHITTSVGAAWVPAGFEGPAEDIIKAADVMLYRSKDTGRDRVSVINLGESSGGKETPNWSEFAPELSTREEEELTARAQARLKAAVA